MPSTHIKGSEKNGSAFEILATSKTKVLLICFLGHTKHGKFSSFSTVHRAVAHEEKWVFNISRERIMLFGPSKQHFPDSSQTKIKLFSSLECVWTCEYICETQEYASILNTFLPLPTLQVIFGTSQIYISIPRTRQRGTSFEVSFKPYTPLSRLLICRGTCS